MIDQIIDASNSQMYPYEFKVYENFIKVLEWLDDFFQKNPLDVLVTVEQPKYIDVSTMTSMHQQIMTDSGYIRAMFRHERDALAFKLIFGL